MPPALARVLLLLVVPLAAVGPALLPGRRFLPLAPRAFAPLSSEASLPPLGEPASPDLLAVDAILPLLTDRLAIRERVLAGDLPLWEPRLGLGLPLLGTTMAGPFYPPGVLRLLLPPDLAAGWHALGALFLAGLGLWLFLARRGLAPGACAIGALALQAGGWGLTNLHLDPKVDAALWLPWALWAIDGLLARRRLAGLALFGATAFPLLAGFPGVAAFGLLTAILYAIARAAAPGTDTAQLGRALAFLGLGLVGAAIQLVPTWSASAQSLRAPLAASEVQAQALPAGTSLALVLPHLFGAPDSPLAADRDPLTWWLTQRDEAPRAEQANALEWDLFAGVGVLVLALAALVARPRQALFPALLALAALGFAQGWPGLALLYHLPGLNLGTPARAAALAWVAWPWLAALGAQALLDRAPRARSAALGLALLLGGLAAAAVLTTDAGELASGMPETLAARFGVDGKAVAARVDLDSTLDSVQRLRSAWRHVALLAAAALLATLAATGRRRSRPGVGFWLPLAVLVAGEGLWVGWPHLAPCRIDAERPLFPASASMAALRTAAADGRVLRLDRSESGVSEVLELARPNLPQAYDVADLTPYVPLPPRLLVELLAAIDPRSRYRTGTSRISDPRLVDHPVLDRLRVTALLSVEPLEHPRLEPVLERRGFHVYRRSGSLPPAWIVPSAVWATSDSTGLGLLASRVVEPEHAVVLCGTAPDDEPPPDVEGAFEPGTLVLRRPRPEELEVDVRGSSGGWLVLSEAWSPGWSARVDGQRARLVRADHALRALRVPPGDSLVRLRYHPPGFRIGAALSLLALLAAVLSTLRARPGPAL